MKIGPEFLAQEMWTLPSWQQVVQLHFVKKIQQHPQQQNICATDEKLLQLAQRLREVGK